MRVLITGGTGFIGRALCRALTAAGSEVWVYSRRPERVTALCGESVHPLTSLTPLASGLAFDAAINLAGESIVGARWSEKRKQLLRDSRIAVTEQLVTGFARSPRPPAVLLSGSAVGYYGDSGDRIVEESAPSGVDFGARLCADWEAAAAPAAALGMRVCLLRTGLVLGPDGGFLDRMLLPFRLGLGARLGDGRQWMSWIHRDDYVAMLLHLLHDARAMGAFNMSAPEPVHNAGFTAALARCLRRPAFLAAPAPLLRLALGEMSELLLGGQRAPPTHAQALGFGFAHAGLESALGSILRDTARSQ
jgi:uncharacterized protein